MSVPRPEDIKDGDCKRGRVTQQPPISYAQFKYPKWLTEPDSVKVRLPKGNQYTCDSKHDTSNAGTYLKWFQTYLCVLGEKELHAPLDAATRVCKKLLKDFKKFSFAYLAKRISVCCLTPLPWIERSSSKIIRSSSRSLRGNSRRTR
jgi:hypothetical protein